ncbi:MAG: prepilin peptidase, partial [Lachnospiraceae bacterium]|nr:prepilin peptidase [Lachnospiraceae bacterium]
CACASVMIVISVIDERTKSINLGLNIFIGILGVARVALDYANWLYYIIGMLAVSVPFLIIVIVSEERAMGLGDVYLMAAAGLLMGWKHILLAVTLGCALGSVIHIIRMKVSKKGSELAFGPYLCLGIYLTILFGEPLLRWYTSFIVHR